MVTGKSPIYTGFQIARSQSARDDIDEFRFG